jgi:hypothetical protein
MNNVLKIAGLAVFGCASLIASTAHADDFVNGSFESPSIGDNTYISESGQDVDGWTISNGDSALVTNDFDGTGSGTTWWDSGAGLQYLYVAQSVGDGVVVSQSVDVTAGEHTLSFLQADFASNFETPGGAVLVSILNPDDSVLLAPTLFSTGTFSPFIQQSLNFNAATAGGYTVQFTSVGGQAGIIDDVHMDAAAPEPASMFLVALGAAAIAKRRRTGA